MFLVFWFVFLVIIDRIPSYLDRIGVFWVVFSKFGPNLSASGPNRGSLGRIGRPNSVVCLYTRPYTKNFQPYSAVTHQNRPYSSYFEGIRVSGDRIRFVSGEYSTEYTLYSTVLW